MGVNVEIGKRLRSFRQNKNLTQVELATVAGRSKQLVSAWEAGRAEITIESVTRLARTVGLDPRWLLMGDRGMSDRLTSDRASGKEEHRDALIGTRMPFRTIEQIVRAGTAEALQQATDTVVTTYHDYPAGCFAMPCPDGSLHPTIRAADLLIIDPTALPRPGQWVAAAIFAEKEVQ